MEQKKQLAPAEAKEAVRKAYNLLNDVYNSRHTAFTSPSPSSTESIIKNHVIKARNLLDIAYLLMKP